MLETTQLMSMPSFKGLEDLDRRLTWYDTHPDGPQPFFYCDDCEERVYHLATSTKEYLEALDAHQRGCGT